MKVSGPPDGRARSTWHSDGTYGVHRITADLCADGEQVDHKLSR
ncbi:hypothetical protein [Streptomyces sp. NPDC012510]